MIPAQFSFPKHRIRRTRKGGIALSAIGYIQMHAYTGNARIPLEGVAITVTDPDGKAIAMRLTNRSGILDAPISIAVPDLSAGQTPNTGIIPFSDVNLYAHLADFETIEIENLQVFPNTLTVQDLAMIPLAELPDSWNKAEIFNTPPQNL